MKDRLTAHQIHYPFIREATLSPDGSRVVYTVEEARLTDVGGHPASETVTHLYLVTTAGDPQIQLTFGQHINRAPRWSPDGRYLAFLSTRGGNVNLYAI